MYLSMWIFVIFQGFILSNIFIEIVGILTWGNLYFIRIQYEEKIMTIHLKMNIKNIWKVLEDFFQK